MRITTQMISDRSIAYMNKSLEQVHALQNQVSSGKKFQNVSDDPTAAMTSLLLRSSLSGLSGQLETIANAKTWMSANEYSFNRIEAVTQDAILLATRGINDTMSDTERATMGRQIDTLLTEAVQAANTTHEGQYLFSGFQVFQQPFTLNAGTVTYTGGSGEMTRTIGPNENVTINIDGQAAFMPLFQQLAAARDALLSNQPANLSTALDGLQTALDTITNAHTLNGTRINQATSAQDYSSNIQLELQTLLSTNENVNLAEAMSMLELQENNYHIILQVSQRAVSALSLFDYLD